MVFSTSKFESFSIRPPTPPKDLKDIDSANDADDVLQFINDPFGTVPVPPRIHITKSLLNTPEQSPSSETGSSANSDGARKRVNFQLQTCTIPSSDPVAHPWTPRHSSPLRPLPQTRVLKPLKSILKAYEPSSTPPPTEGAAAHKFETFADMLESVVKMLAQGSRPSKLDAYISLQRTMQAYDKVPDVEALKDKMGLLSQFIQRDMLAASPTGNGQDSQLISQALKLLMALVRITELKPAMDDDFCAFVIERIIHVAQDAQMPKTVINTHLALLMQQNFRQRIMTVARIDKILDALEDIQDRVSGYSVLAYRIRIYRKLIQQRPDVMSKHTELWFKHTIKAMLSTQKDINQSALDTAMCAAKTFGTDRSVTKAVLAVLNRVKSDGDSFAKLIAQELERMLGTEHASLAPQIWGATTALLRDSWQPQMFPAMRDWLSILEKFVRSDNEAVKIHANVAFNFLIYAVNITQHTSSGWSGMLLNILQHRIQRRENWKKSEAGAATSGYFTLLYYALRPDGPTEQLDRYWKDYVVGFWKPLLNSPSTKHSVAACRIVSSLLGGSRRPWSEQRALEMKPQFTIQREELPLLDPKWVRKSLSTVLSFVEMLLDITPWTPDAGEDEPAKTVWIALLDSLVEAGSKEVMATTETKDAIAHVVNSLRRMWDRHTTKLALPQHKEDNWADKFCFLINTVVQKLGPYQFADKCLTRNASDEFEVAPTPSHRSRHQGPRLSPLLYFIELLMCRSEGRLSDDVRLRVVQLMLEPCFDAQNSRLAKLELLKDCSVAVEPSENSIVASSFWAQIAMLAKACFEIKAEDEHLSLQLGKEYDVLVEILALGSRHLLDAPIGQELLASFTAAVQREAGDGAVVMAAIEKVSEAVLKKVSDTEGNVCIPFVNILLRSLPANINRRILEQGRQKMWPSSPTLPRGHDFDPYNHFYASVVAVGSGAYQSLNTEEEFEKCREFLSTLASTIPRCPISLLAIYLRRTQPCTTLWVVDPNRKLQKPSQQAKQLYKEVSNLWQAVLEAIGRLPRKDSSLLLALEPLITSGFATRRRGLVNASIAAWNNTFGKEESLRYPSRLEDALQRLRGTVDLLLPSLPARIEDDDSLSFYESDASETDARRRVPSTYVQESPLHPSHAKRKSKSKSPAMSTVSRRGTFLRDMPRVRLRHDNSQILFEPILSSPSDPFNQESQILTERQKEMVGRQRMDANIFSAIRSTDDPQSSGAVSGDIRSDAIGVDDLPALKSRTPLKALVSLGPMDVFLGSSPTPHSRNHSEQILSDDTSVATPTAVRTIQAVDDGDEIGSSPPRFEKHEPTDGELLMSNDTSEDFVDDSFAYAQAGKHVTSSFDEAEAVGEEYVPGPPDAAAYVEQDIHFVDDFASDGEASDLQSSTVELQLTAQLHADIDARIASSSQDLLVDAVGDASRANTAYVDEHSHPMPEGAVECDINYPDDTRVQDTQAQPATIDGDEHVDSSSNSTSRVGDSFLALELKNGPDPTPHTDGLRRSSRASVIASANRSSSSQKRKGSPLIKQSKKQKTGQDANMSSNLADPSPEKPDTLEAVAANSPTKRRGRGRLLGDKSSGQARSRSKSQVPSEGSVIVPETTRKRSLSRSTSLKETLHPGTVLVEETPASKRPKTRGSQDVSAARATLEIDSGVSQSNRLSHVRASPRHSSSSSARESSTSPDNEGTTMDALPDRSGHVSPSLGEQNAKVALQLQGDTASPLETSQQQSSQAAGAIETPSRSFKDRVILTPRSILGKLRDIKRMFSELPQLIFSGQEMREAHDLLFDLGVAAHAAHARGEANE